MNRRLLTSLVVIGVVGALAAGSTFALFNDTETSDTNTFEAGALDLQIDWVESYNGEVIEEQEFTDNPGSIFDIQDVKPGDQGEANISLHVYDNPAFVNMTMEQTANRENGCTEPEAEVDNSCADPGEGEGELGEHLEFTITDNDGDVVFDGTADELDQQNINLGLVDNSTTEYVTIEWNVPRETGNEIQTDSKHFRFDFSAVQARHNDGAGGEQEPPIPDDNDTNMTPPDDDDNVTIPGDNDTDDNDTNVTDPDDNLTNATATVNFENQTSDGKNVVVDSANLPDEGFIAIHDASLLEGDAVGSVIGVSEHLEAGTHQNVEVELFDVPGLFTIQSVDGAQLQESQTLIAMPHLDTNDNETYDFIVTNGSEDGPYTEDGEPVTDSAFITVENDTNVTPPDNDTNMTNTSVNFENQTSNGSEVTVEEASTSEGGFVAVLNEAGTVLGASDYLSAGEENNIDINLAPELNVSQWLTAQVYNDSNDDQDFNRSEDASYTDNGTNVTDDAFINVTNGTNMTPPDDNDTNQTPDNETLQGINTVWFCDNGTESTDTPCPSGERSVATVEWNGTNFEPVQIANDTNVDLNLTARLQDGDILEVRWFSANELTSVAAQSNGATCTFPGGTQGVAVVCDPPSTIEIDERLPTLVIEDDNVETVEE